MPDDENTEEKKSEKQDSVPERVTFWVSVFLVLSLFGFLAFRAVRDGQGGEKLPKITAVVETNKAKRMDATHWLVPVSVRNTGELAVEEMLMRVTYRTKNGEQDADISFAYLAGGAQGDALIVTDLPPQEAKVRVFVLTLQTQRKARGY